MGAADAIDSSLLSSASLPVPLPLKRWAAVGGLLLVEYLAASVAFDVQPLKAQASWIGWSGDAAVILLVAVTAVLALARAPNEAALAQVRARLFRLPNAWVWGAAHALAVGAFFACTAGLSEGGLASPASAPGLSLLWMLTASAVVATALGIAIPIRAAMAVGKLAVRPAIVGLLAGALAWEIARGTERLWPSVSVVTLEGAATLLRWLAPHDLFEDPEQLYLGIRDFVVEVSGTCSGVQGMGLIGALTLAYVVRFRTTLRFPRALAVVPLAMAAAFALNVLRIATLVWVGGRISPNVAVGGFHSKAGWLASCLLAWAVLFWVRRSPALRRTAPAERQGVGEIGEIEAENPTVRYLAPLMVSLGLYLLAGLFVSSFDLLYPARALIVAGVLAFVLPWRRLTAHGGWRPAAAPLLIGAAIVPIWVLLVRSSPERGTTLLDGLASLSPWQRAVWMGMRVFGAVLLAPVTEELAFRGFLLRRLYAAAFERASYAEASRRPIPLVLSALAFGALERSFVAGTLAGLAYGLALLPRGRLSDAISAHLVTNAILMGYVVATGSWSLIG